MFTKEYTPSKFDIPDFSIKPARMWPISEWKSLLFVFTPLEAFVFPPLEAFVFPMRFILAFEVPISPGEFLTNVSYSTYWENYFVD